MARLRYLNSILSVHRGVAFAVGDVVGLLLDCDAGTLTVKKNGKRLGVAATSITGRICYM